MSDVPRAKVAIYCRVSTSKQDLENQLQLLQTVSQQRGYEVYRIYQDIVSGKQEARKEFQEMLDDAAKGKFRAIFTWALDRLSREGLAKTVYLIEHLDRLGVRVISYSEPFLDTTNELARNILLATLSTLAKWEREKISERTRAGLDRLKRQGRRLGRPPVPQSVREKILELAQAGKSGRAIARELKISHTFVGHVLNGKKTGVSEMSEDGRSGQEAILGN
jgi:DNA invertase Pin-like site-specific DNA recombinase